MEKNLDAVQYQIEVAKKVGEYLDEDTYIDLLDALASAGYALAPAVAYHESRNIASEAYVSALAQLSRD
jgi:hypothetical protein